jgi:tryptophan synthase alpha chain
MTALHPSAAYLAGLLERTGPPPLGVHLPAGYPTIGGSAAVLERAVRTAGAQFILLGVPTAHPYLDGLDITRAHIQALRCGTAMADVLAVVRQLVPIAPVVVTIYGPPAMQYGLTRLAEALSHAGAAGCMIPDLPEDEAPTWHRAAATFGLLAPRRHEDTARPARMLRITQAATGWVHIPAAAAQTTGQEAPDVPALHARSARIRLYCAPPIVAESDSTPEHAADAAPLVGGIVIGSALARALHDHPGPDGADAAVHLVSRYTRALRAVPAGPSPPPQGPGEGRTS